MASPEIDATLGQLYAIIESAVDAIVTIDQSGTILFANAATERLFGYARSALVGSSLDLLLPTHATMRHAAHLRTLRSTDDHAVIGRHREIDARHRDGTLIPVEIAITRTWIDGRLTYTGIVRDVRDRRAARETLARLNVELMAQVSRRNAELDDARHQADASGRAKDSFLAAVSHELRTPMNAILGGLTLLMDTPLDEEQREMVTIAVGGSEQLLGLVDDVLAYAEVEAGAVAVVAADFDVAAFAEEAVGAIRQRAAAKGLAVRLSVAPELPARWRQDAARLRQVLRTLLDNAVKFTSEGTVTLAVTATHDANRAPALRFEVQDTGIGVPAEILPFVFDRLTMGDNSPTRRHGGLGLGLALAKRLVERLGGAIDVASSPGAGSTFALTVPPASFVAAQRASSVSPVRA
jgi:PAS domain S-box-containing protein